MPKDYLHPGEFSMTNPRKDQIDKASPTDFMDNLRITAPALTSALLAMLPVSARDANVLAVPVASNTTAALGDAALGSGVAGAVLSVTSTVGTVTGVFTVVSGVPATTEARAVYDADGIPTISFLPADAVTECELVMNALPSNFKALMAAEAGP